MKIEIIKSLSEAKYKEIIRGASQLEATAALELTAEFEAYRTMFINGLDDIEDDEDMAYYVAVKYVEIKAHWIQMNLRLNYQAVLKGAADQVMLVRAALFSHFLSLVEPKVDQHQLGLINDLLASRLAA